MMSALGHVVRRDDLAACYRPLYAFQIASHRVLRYLTPFLHLLALAATSRARRGWFYVLTFAVQSRCWSRRCWGVTSPLLPLRIAALRTHDRLDRGRPLGSAARSRGPGRIDGDPWSRALYLLVAALALGSSPPCSPWPIAIRLEAPG